MKRENEVARILTPFVPSTRSMNELRRWERSMNDEVTMPVVRRTHPVHPFSENWVGRKVCGDDLHYLGDFMSADVREFLGC